MLLKVGLLGLVLVGASFADADARNSSSRYSMYGYGSSGNGNYDGGTRYSSHSPSFEGYTSRSRGGSTGRYWGSVRVQKYNDPTGKRIIQVSEPTPPLPSGNYGRAFNRLRQAY